MSVGEQVRKRLEGLDEEVRLESPSTLSKAFAASNERIAHIVQF